MTLYILIFYADMQKGNDSMKLYLSADTDIEDLLIDHIEVKLVTGETVFIDWDQSEIERLDNGFDACYRSVSFDQEYANGKLSSLCGMQINKVGLDSESEIDSDIVITDMMFEDDEEQYIPGHLLPYVIKNEECEMS